MADWEEIKRYGGKTKTCRIEDIPLQKNRHLCPNANWWNSITHWWSTKSFDYDQILPVRKRPYWKECENSGIKNELDLRYFRLLDEGLERLDVLRTYFRIRWYQEGSSVREIEVWHNR